MASVAELEPGLISERTKAALAAAEARILTPRGGAWHPTSAARLLSRLHVAS
jgi:DNA invertase Pin-like site-specific DNA recombinase